MMTALVSIRSCGCPTSAILRDPDQGFWELQFRYVAGQLGNRVESWPIEQARPRQCSAPHIGNLCPCGGQCGMKTNAG